MEKKKKRGFTFGKFMRFLLFISIVLTLFGGEFITKVFEDEIAVAPAIVKISPDGELYAEYEYDGYTYKTETINDGHRRGDEINVMFELAYPDEAIEGENIMDVLSTTGIESGELIFMIISIVLMIFFALFNFCLPFIIFFAVAKAFTRAAANSSTQKPDKQPMKTTNTTATITRGNYTKEDIVRILEQRRKEMPTTVSTKTPDYSNEYEAEKVRKSLTEEHFTSRQTETPLTSREDCYSCEKEPKWEKKSLFNFGKNNDAYDDIEQFYKSKNSNRGGRK